MTSGRRTLLQFGSSHTDADMLYGSKFISYDPFLFLEHQGKSYLIVSGFEADRARSQTAVDEVWSSATLVSGDANRRKDTRLDASPAGIAAAALRKVKTRSTQVPSRFPVGVVDALRKVGFRITVLKGDVYPQRLIKSDEEIRAITKVQRATDKAMAAAALILRKSRVQKNRLLFGGKTLCVEHLRRAIHTTLIEESCLATQIIVAPGDQAAEPHNLGSGIIRPGKPVVIDIFPRSMHTHYWADMTRTFIKGRPSDQLIRQYRIVAEAQRLALSLIRPGVLTRSVHRAVERFMEASGYITGNRDGCLQGFIHSTGHGLGLDLHEQPMIGKSSQTRFRKGMVVTVEPGLYYKKAGSVRIEDLVVVTQYGVRNLTRFPKKMVL